MASLCLEAESHLYTTGNQELDDPQLCSLILKHFQLLADSFEVLELQKVQSFPS